MRVLYEHIASQYIRPVRKLRACGDQRRYWGVHNVAQFNKDFLRDHFKTEDGVRWKVPAVRWACGLEYSVTMCRYTTLRIKNKDNDASWKR
jgi:hypothetical protein